jgi:hypothetical protein
MKCSEVRTDRSKHIHSKYMNLFDNSNSRINSCELHVKSSLLSPILASDLLVPNRHLLLVEFGHSKANLPDLVGLEGFNSSSAVGHVRVIRTVLNYEVTPYTLISDCRLY